MEKNEKLTKRGRPQGSKNKPKGSSLFNINLEKQIKNAPINRENALGWINWGSRNTYPFDLINLYSNSITHRACVDFFQNALVGGGLDLDAMKARDIDLQNPNPQTDWNTFIKSLAFDFGLYGGFAFQVILNKDRKTFSYYHQPFETIRFEKMDEEGKINNAYICSDWSSYMKYGYEIIPLFNFMENEKVEYGKPYLFAYVPYSPMQTYYPTPIYSSGIKAIQSEIEFINYDLKHIINGFTPSGMLVLPPAESEEDKQAIVDNVQRMFQGSDNTNTMMISFSNGIEDANNVKFEPFIKDDSADIYEKANARCVERICAAHKIPSKSLIGFQLQGNGFTSEGGLLEAAFSLYNTNVANTFRNLLVSSINTAFKANGIETEIVLKPLQYQLDEAEDQTNEDNTIEEDNNE